MLEDVLKDKVSLFETGVSTCLRLQENRMRNVALVQGNLVSNSRSEASGVCARVCKDGVYGFSSAAGSDSEKIKAVLKVATDNALFLAKHAGKGYELPAVPGAYLPVKKVIVDTEQKRIIERCQELDEYVAKKYTGLASRTVVYAEDSMDKVLYTSDAASGHITSPRCYIYVFMTVISSQGTPLELFKALGGFGSFEDNFGDMAKHYEELDRLYESIMKKKDGVYAEAGYKQVILGGMMTGMLSHEAVGHTTEADLVRSGSVAGPSFQKMVASEKVTMIDFAHTAFGKDVPLPVYMDDEGIAAEDVVIIKNGLLTEYMNSRDSARHFGVAPKGNARAWSFSDEPLIRMRNTAILPGTDKLADMIASVEDGYYLLNSTNGQADLTGEFMFGVSEGYEIKNGKLGRALLDTTVSGIAFEMLKTVDMVSDEVVWSSSGYCGKKQRMPVGMGGPALRCKIMIGGR